MYLIDVFLTPLNYYLICKCEQHKKPMKFVAFVLVLILHLSVVKSEPPKPTSATYQIKTATINGIEYKTAVFNAEFDQDLYVLDNFPCQCGICSNTVLSPAADENSFNITDLNIGEWVEGSLIGFGSIRYYRFDTDASQSCDHITFEIEMYHGYVSLVAATGRMPTLADYDWYRPVTGRRIFRLCNAHSKFGQGRFYVGVIVNQHNEYNRYKIRYVTTPNPNCPPAIPTPEIPVGYPAGFQWLQEGQASRGYVERESYNYYGFQVTTLCTRFAVSLQKNSSGEADLFMSVDNKPLGLGQPIDPRRDWLSNNDGDDVISIHYCHDSAPFTFFIAVTAFDVATGYDLVATTQSGFDIWPVSGIALNSPFTHLSHSYRLECESPDGAAVEQFFCEFAPYIDCYRDGYFCCFPFYPLSAIETPNPLWPWNAGDSSLKAFSEILWDGQNFNQTHQSNKLSVGLMISQIDENNINLFVQSTDMSKCHLIWTGQITNAQGESIRDDLTFEPASLKCTESFERLVASSAEIINEMSLSVDYLELTKAHYKLNFEFLLEDWYGCNEFIKTLGNTSDFNVVQNDLQVCLHFPNTQEFANDPCCNQALLNDQCCVPSDLTVSTALLKQVNSSLVTDMCSNPTCSLKQLNNLIGLQRGVLDADTGCTSAFRREANTAKYDGFLVFINDCQNKILGERLQGVKCSKDSECFSGACNITQGLCQQGNAEFIQCLVANIETSIARFMFNNWGLRENVTSSRLAEELANRFTLPDACVGPTGIEYRDHYLYGREQLTCSDQCPPSLEPRCLDKTCYVPAECDEERTGICYRSYRLIRGDPANCLNDMTCNWLDCSALSEAQCQNDCETFVDPEFCGDCSAGSLPCIDTGLNQTECSQGTCDIAAVPLNECTTTGVCSAQCGGVDCANEGLCLASGSCSDKDMFAAYIAQYGPVSGVCLRLKAHDQTFIASCEANEIDSPIGCGLPAYLTEANCTANGHTWWTWAVDSDTCLAFPTCAETIYQNSFVSWKTEAECTGCNGKFGTAFTWTNGIWRTGTVRPLVWMPRAYVPVNSYGESFDVIAFRSAASAAVVSRLAPAYTTEAVCRYGGTVNALSSLMCDCNSNFNEGECYANLDATQLIGVVRACPYISSSIKAVPAKLTVLSSTMSTESFCKPVQIELTSAEFYTAESSIALSSEIYNTRLSNDYSVVTNAIGGIVGQIISDGISINIDLSDATSLANPFELCIDIDQDIEQARTYSVLGFGQLLDNGTIVVLDQEVNATDTAVCAKVYNGTYFAIAREKEWEGILPYDELQASLKWVGLALYFLVVVFGVFQLAFVATNIRSLVRGKQKVIFIAIVLIFNIFRGIYFAFPINSFRDFYIVQYLLFELPTFLFFTIYTIILYLWSGVLIKQSVLAKGKARVQVRRIRTVYIIVNAIMYAVFVLLVLLNQFLPQSQDECRIGSANNATSTRYYIILAYQIFIAAVCFGVSLAFMIQGIKFIIIFKKAKLTNTSGKKDKRRNLITFIAVTCTALFIGRTIVFLYAAVTGNPVTIIIFVLFEVLPSLALLYYLRPYDWKRPFSTAKNSSETKPSRKGATPGSAPMSKLDSKNIAATSSHGEDSARSKHPVQTVVVPEHIHEPTGIMSENSGDSSEEENV